MVTKGTVVSLLQMGSWSTVPLSPFWDLPSPTSDAQHHKRRQSSRLLLDSSSSVRVSSSSLLEIQIPQAAG